jgi:hypothetical protein
MYFGDHPPQHFHARYSGVSRPVENSPTCAG